MSNLKLIIKREFIARVRNRTFVVMTFLSPIIMVVMVLLITWLASLNKDEVKKIAFVDKTELFKADFKDTKGIDYIDYSDLHLNDAKDSVMIRKLDGLLYIPKEENTTNLASSIQFYAEESPNIDMINAIEDVLENRITEQNYISKGFDLNTIKEAEARVDIRIENFSGEKTSKYSSYVKMFFGGVAGYLLMMFVVIYGNMVMRSVIEEKANRIIEIIISSVKPIQLMMGKILGTSLAGVLQFLIWAILGGLLMAVVSLFVNLDIDPNDIQENLKLIKESEGTMMAAVTELLLEVQKLPIITLLFSFLIYFIGGYFLYSAIYAAIGAAVDSETDSQQFMLPIILPLMLGIYVGFFSVINNPHGSVSTVFSMIPLTSSIVMLMRIPFGVPWWEILISMILLFSSVIGITWFAAKIYRIGILMYGKKPSYKELFKWLRY